VSTRSGDPSQVYSANCALNNFVLQDYFFYNHIHYYCKLLPKASCFLETLPAPAYAERNNSYGHKVSIERHSRQRCAMFSISTSTGKYSVPVRKFLTTWAEYDEASTISNGFSLFCLASSEFCNDELSGEGVIFDCFVSRYV
jgi:hypothetical protein